LTVRFVLPLGFSLERPLLILSLPRVGLHPSPGFIDPWIGTISMDDLHDKFETISLPTYFLSDPGSMEFPRRLERFLVSRNSQSKVKKLVLNLCTPTPHQDGVPALGHRKVKDPLTFGADWARINTELSTSVAWKGLEEVVLDMSGPKSRDWKAEDIERIGEYLGSVSLPGLSSKVKLTVLT
jgi:hypothetical protein